MTSGASARSSSAYLRKRPASPGPAVVDPHVAAVGPAQLLQRLQERRDAGLAFRIVRGHVHEHADAPHALGLLRPRRERPRRRAPPSSVMNSRRLKSNMELLPGFFPGAMRELAVPLLCSHPYDSTSRAERRCAAGFQSGLCLQAGHSLQIRPRPLVAQMSALHPIPTVNSGLWDLSRCAIAQNRCAIARCAGSPTASAVIGGEIVNSGRGALS